MDEPTQNLLSKGLSNINQDIFVYTIILAVINQKRSVAPVKIDKEKLATE